MQQPNEIPSGVRDAFGQALGACYNWMKDGGSEPEISLDRKLFSFDLICDLVEKFTCTMPDKYVDFLRDLAKRAHREGLIPAERSYASGARCLMSLVQHQRCENDLRAKVRGGCPG